MYIDEIVDSIAGQYNKELDHVFKERIKSLVLNARAEVIRQYMDKYNRRPASLISQINCLDMTEVDIAECCVTTLDCTVWKTVEKVPAPIRLRDGSDAGFIYVGSIDNSNSLGYIVTGELPDLLADRFISNSRGFYSYVNEHIYVHNVIMKKLRVIEITTDPYKVYELNDCDGNDGCAEVLNIPDDYIVLIKDFVYRELRGTAVLPEKEEITLENDDDKSAISIQ